MCHKLIDYNSFLSRGLRLEYTDTDSSRIEWMIVGSPIAGFHHSLMVLNGKQRGEILIFLSEESFAYSSRSIDIKWLINNWNKSILPNSDINKVYVLDKRSKSEELDSMNQISQYAHKNFLKLMEYQNELVECGSVFSLPSQWPYDDWVEFMLYKTHDLERPYGIIVFSGYKSGLVLVNLPKESHAKNGNGIQTEWLINNWEKWVYPECNIKDVILIL